MQGCGWERLMGRKGGHGRPTFEELPTALVVRTPIRNQDL